MLIRKAIREPGKAFSVALHKMLAPVGHCDYRHFIVLTRDRTGSNMLIQMMNSHPNIAADYEIFAKLNGRTEQSVLDKAFSRQPFYVKAKGFKIFYYHPQDTDSATIWNFLESITDLYVVHLKRRNILRALISSRIAYMTGIYGVRSEKEKSVYQKKVSSIFYPVDDLRKHMEQTRAWEEKGEEKFKKHPMISIDYEDLVNHRNQTFKKVTDFLSVTYKEPRTDFKKQTTQSLRELLENYDLLKDQFRGSEWEVFFDE